MTHRQACARLISGLSVMINPRDPAAVPRAAVMGLRSVEFDADGDEHIFSPTATGRRPDGQAHPVDLIWIEDIGAVL